MNSQQEGGYEKFEMRLSKITDLFQALSSEIEALRHEIQKEFKMDVKSINPSTGHVIKEFASMSAQDVATAVNKAAAAFETWSKTPFEKRAELFQSFGKKLLDAADELTTLIRDETGKRDSDAAYEIFDFISIADGGSGGIDFCIKQMKEILQQQERKLPGDYLPHGMGPTTAKVQLLPHGVVGMIMPWNFPLWIPLVNIIPVLMAGNTVVFKPSEYSTLVGLKIKELFEKAGFPQDILQVIIGGEETGKALVQSEVNQIWITGSVEAGVDVLSKAGVRPVEVELGGNSASIVCEDADIDLAVAGSVWGATYNAGQSCSGIKRVFVHEAVAKDFIDKAVEAVKSLRTGIDYGPLIRSSQRDIAVQRIKSAVKAGAQVLTGGEIPNDLPEDLKNGYWLKPTVLIYEDHNLDLVAEETFANVMPIFVVKSEKEAVDCANNTPYGLTNAIWTKDSAKGNRLASQLQSGMVFINEVEVALLLGEFWRGWKNSSIPGVGSKLDRCFKQQLFIEYQGSEPREYWYPYE